MPRLGPEPLGDVFTLTALRHALRRHGRAAIKAVLLDQSVVAGIGNLYADETLYRARIHPARRAALLPVRRRTVIAGRGSVSCPTCQSARAPEPR